MGRILVVCRTDRRSMRARRVLTWSRGPEEGAAPHPRDVTGPDGTGKIFQWQALRVRTTGAFVHLPPCLRLPLVLGAASVLGAGRGVPAHPLQGCRRSAGSLSVRPKVCANRRGPFRACERRIGANRPVSADLCSPSGGKALRDAVRQPPTHLIAPILADAPCAIGDIFARVFEESVNITLTSAMLDRERTQQLNALTTE